MAPQHSDAEPLDESFELHGGNVARQLLGAPCGDNDHWRACLQEAADISLQNAEVLRICDDLFAAGSDLRTATAVRAYAESTFLTVSQPPAIALLRGMRDAC